MKVLHVTPTYLPAYRYGGPVKIIHQLNKWLVKLGCDVTVYTTNIDGPNNLDIPLNQPISVDGVKIYYFPITYRSWQYSYRLHRYLARNVRSFDVIHITSVFLSASMLGAYYARKFGKPYIISPHGSFMEDPLRHRAFKKKLYISLIERKNLKKADAIHFVAEAEKDDYLKTKLPLNRALVIPNGIDKAELGEIPQEGSFRKRYGIAAGKKIVLFLGRLNWKKGLDTLIPAFAEIAQSDPEAILALVGPDESGYKKNIERLIDDYNIRNKIIFTGLVMGQDLIVAYKDSDVFVLPAYSEACSMALIEAMHFGLSPVITKNVGFSEKIAHFGAGITVEKDAEELAAAIRKLLADAGFRKKMRAKAEEFADREFSIERVAEKFTKAYREIARGK